jgi:hypothetical protein
LIGRGGHGGLQVEGSDRASVPVRQRPAVRHPVRCDTAPSATIARPDCRP